MERLLASVFIPLTRADDLIESVITVIFLSLLHFSTESAYDLLPPELQLPFSAQQDLKIMSQKSGGEAGPPPSALLASGVILLL